MRLKKLKVSGFKSFVDPTDIRLPGNLVGVVGPNGCGKSNVIDAVRWVMGEASAKMLRGDNMLDVIFNGSSARKPVGKASVELIFDNNDGKAGGNYSQFAEISIKRTLSRDGQSLYFINNMKSRRKDVLDLFRGTGLGPRSYSIIEQGMVSRIVEARPDDLRVFVEEAAGTSRYKDRRRETEIRIKHTRENLDRVADIRNELEKQLRRLQRQSSAARRYKVLKDEERQVDGQLQLLRLNAFESQLQEQNRISAERENALEMALATQRETEAELERAREQQSERQEQNSQVQQDFYGIGAEIKNIEQRIEHLVETKQRQGEEIERLQQHRSERERELESDRSRLAQFEQDVAALLPELEVLAEQLSEAEQVRSAAEQRLQQWQSSWEEFNREAQEPIRQQEVQRARINQFEQHLAQATQREEKLQTELLGFQQHLSGTGIADLRSRVAAHDQNLDQKEQAFSQTEQQIQGLRDAITEKRGQSSDLKARQQEVASRLQSLREIQIAALGGNDDEAKQWLERQNLAETTRLAGKIKVEPGWERAADRVLNGFIKAVCVDQDSVSVDGDTPDATLSLVTMQKAKVLPAHSRHEKLIDRVSAGDFDLSSLLSDVYIADTLQQAIQMQPELFSRDYIVTKDGTLVGSNWISFASKGQMETGVLVREEEIKQLDTRLSAIEIELHRHAEEVEQLDAERGRVESRLREQRDELNMLRAEKTSLHNQLGREEAKTLEVEQRSQQVTVDIQELASQVKNDHDQIGEAKNLLQAAEEQGQALVERRASLETEKQELEREITALRGNVNQLREQHHTKQLQKQRMESASESVKEHLNRVQQQFDSTSQRLAEINSALSDQGDPVAALNEELAGLLERRVEAEKKFTVAKDEMNEVENKIISLNQSRNQHLQQVNVARESLEEHKLQKQEVVVRKQTQEEHVAEMNIDREALMAELPENPLLSDWQQSLETIQRKVERIGPVNLVAIEEFEEESTRKEYLDSQHNDLVEALETLESVIRKIDRETRSRFKETFDKLNAGFNDFFPQLFGGGTAELQLTSDDLLTAGVTVMARPPGKRNSTIHLLSGGEKALTAVALLFSLFRLNPAPFCMLDEVDAPLDDANVDRYCKTLKTLAEISQIVVITHNKITMEASDLLVGVTMAEPGVSRMVSVDIDQAVEMASH